MILVTFKRHLIVQKYYTAISDDSITSQVHILTWNAGTTLAVHW